MIAQVIIGATIFSFLLSFASLETSKNRATAILKISVMITSPGAIQKKYDVISFDQRE